MDARIIKGVAVLIAVGLHFASASLPLELQGYLMELAGAICGWAALRRPGDLGPLVGKGDQ